MILRVYTHFVNDFTRMYQSYVRTVLRFLDDSSRHPGQTHRHIRLANSTPTRIRSPTCDR